MPVLTGPAYLATGYLAWVLATTIVAKVRRGSSWFDTLTVPLVGAFLMVAWDLAMDPVLATIDHVWVWEDGGGFFGVPLTNYLGWYFVVWSFMQLFALYSRFYGRAGDDPAEAPLAMTVQAIVLYVALALYYVSAWATVGASETVVDRAGLSWQTASITETSAVMAIFVMIFAATVATIRLVQTERERRQPVQAQSAMQQSTVLQGGGLAESEGRHPTAAGAGR